MVREINGHKGNTKPYLPTIFSAASPVIEKKQRTNEGRGKEKRRGNETGVAWSVPIFFPKSSYTVSED